MVRDPANPERIRPAFDSGDHLHPNDPGYEAMGKAIDISVAGAEMRGPADWRGDPLFVGDEVDVEVGVGQAGIDEGVCAGPGGIRAHLAAVPSGEVDDFVFGEFSEFAADRFFGNVVKGGNATGADAGGMAASSGEAEKFAAKSGGGGHGIT